MASPGVLRLKFGPLYLKTSLILVNVVELDSSNSTYLLRVERPAVCGGCNDLPIGRRDYPIVLLPRSVDDQRSLRFSIRHGVKGKVFTFYVPSAAVYAHYIAILREAFSGGKRRHNKTVKGHAGPYSYHNIDNNKAGDNVNLSPPHAPITFNTSVVSGRKNVYCIAQDHVGATTFSVYIPNQSLRTGRVFNLPSKWWIEWLAHDICDRKCTPEIFHLTSSSCERLELREMLTIIQPFVCTR